VDNWLWPCLSLILCMYGKDQISHIYISTIFNIDINEILRYNPTIPYQDSMRSDTYKNQHTLFLWLFKWWFLAILFLTLLNQMILTLRLQGVLLTSPLRIGYMESSYGIPLRYQPCSYQCNIELFMWRWASVKGLWIIVRDIPASSKWEFVILNGGVRRAGGLTREVQLGDEFWLHIYIYI